MGSDNLLLWRLKVHVNCLPDSVQENSSSGCLDCTVSPWIGLDRQVVRNGANDFCRSDSKRCQCNWRFLVCLTCGWVCLLSSQSVLRACPLVPHSVHLHPVRPVAWCLSWVLFHLLNWNPRHSSSQDGKLALVVGSFS